MRFELCKWYFDITAPLYTGYFYFARLYLGKLSLAYTAIQRDKNGQAYRSDKWHWGTDTPMEDIQWGRDRLNVGGEVTRLALLRRNLSFEGCWERESRALRSGSAPLYSSPLGECDWRIWAPLSAAHVVDGKDTFEGTGYGDYVRLTVPFWRLPFTRLLWGRLHGDGHWIVIQLLHSDQGVVGFYADEHHQCTNVTITTTYADDGRLDSFRWAGPSCTGEAQVLTHLERQPLLDAKRVTRCIPRRLRRKLARSGVEEKVTVRAATLGGTLTGIMEEVRWDG